jgi:dTDP-4-dehydrorhamnose reductase
MPATLQRVLVTGATGLLGHAVRDRLAGEFQVLSQGFRHGGPGVWLGDLTEPATIVRLAAEPWEAVVHCAALRSPDYCAEHPAEADRLNTLAAVELAEVARMKGARMIHVSTDYVFDGARPPYREDDPCRPVNTYGETKLGAEEGIAAVCPAAAIIRIGALYGVPAPGIPSPMLEEAVTAVGMDAPVELDHRIRRYPLYVGDVAEAVHFLLRNPDLRGVSHVGAQQSATRYEWALKVGSLLGRSTAHLRPALKMAPKSAIRPLDVRLATEHWRALGGPMPRDYDAALPFVLERFITRSNCLSSSSISPCH